MEGFKQGAQTGPGLVEHGQRMGFKVGGHVKASPDFVMKTEKQATMDNANLPRRAKDAPDERTKEMGDQSPVEPGFKKGGKAKKKKEDSSMVAKTKRKIREKKGKNLSALEMAQRSMGIKKKKAGGYMKGGKKKSYGDYDDQPGGSGNEDSHHMDTKKKGGKAHYAEGGLSAAKKVMKDHVKAAPPKGHGVKDPKMAKGGHTMHMRGGKASGRKTHSSVPMYGKG